METTTSATIMGTYVAGYIDYDNRGRKVNLCVLEFELKDGRFSMSGAIWNAAGTDHISGGQNVDEIAGYFPDNARVQRMAAIWKRWHLNDMKAGSPRQEAWLKEHRAERDAEGANARDYYEWACERLAAAGLNPDAEYRYDGEGAGNVKQEGGYRYGSAWVREELPPEVIAEVIGWTGAPKEPAPRPDARHEEEPPTLPEFMREHGITAHVYHAPNNPNMVHEKGDRWAAAANHYRVVFTNASGRTFTAYYSMGSALTRPPKPLEVFENVLRDAADTDGRAFEAWAEELGMERDSRAAEKVYNKCRDVAARLREFLGADYRAAKEAVQ